MLTKTGLGEALLAALGLYFCVRASSQLAGLAGATEEVFSGGISLAFFLPFAVLGLWGLPRDGPSAAVHPFLVLQHAGWPSGFLFFSGGREHGVNPFQSHATTGARHDACSCGFLDGVHRNSYLEWIDSSDQKTSEASFSKALQRVGPARASAGTHGA